MTRSARRAALASLTPCTLSADRQEAVKKYRHARKKADAAYHARVANPNSLTAVALDIVSSALVEEANWDACLALCNERSHYSCKRKPAKQARLLS